MSEEKAKSVPEEGKSGKDEIATAKPPKKEISWGSSEGVVTDKAMVYVDYVARTKDDGTIFDLTLEEVAKKEGIYKEDGRYEPYLVAVGWNWLLGAIEEQLVGMHVGESKTIEVPPEKGTGAKDPKKIISIPIVRLAKFGVKAKVGEKVKMGNDEGVISQVIGRHVRVDFNRPFAGKTLVFDVTVRGIVDGIENKLKAVVKRRIPVLPEDKFVIAVSDTSVTIELPKESRYIEGVQYAEIGIAMDALKVCENAKQVKLVVTFDRPDENKTASETEATHNHGH